MTHKFLVYAVLVTLFSSFACWTTLARQARGGQGSGNSWWTSTSHGGYSGGGWATGGGGGHK